MKGLELQREQMRRVAAQALGLSAFQPRMTPNQIASEARIAEWMAMPPDLDGYSPAQDENGKWKFIAGVSSLSGDDLLVG